MAQKKAGNIDLSAMLSDILEDYTDNIAKNVIPKAVEKVAKETVEVLKTTGKYKDRSENYRKSFNYETKNTYRKSSAMVFSEEPNYRITHLLENGHLTRDGTGRTRAFPHWEPAEKKAVENFENDIINKITKG